VLALPVAGRVDGRADFAGSSVRDATASFQSRITGLAVNNWQIGRLAVNGNVQGQRVAFTATIDENAGSAKLTANVSLADTISYDGTLSARALDLRPIAGKTANIPNAKLNGDLSFNGAGTDPHKLRVQTTLTLYPSQIGDVRVDEGRFDASFENGTLDLKQARIAAAGSVLNARGTISSLLEQRPSGKISYSANLKELQPWLKLAGYSGTGAGIANGSIAGSLQAPQLEGSATLNGLEIAGTRADTARLGWNVSKSVRQTWQGKIDANAKGLVTAVSFQTIEAHADLQPTQPLSAAIAIQARDSNQRVHRAAGRVTYSPDRTDVSVQNLSLQLLEGTWNNPRPIQIMLTKNIITVNDLVLQKNGQSVAAEGTFALDGAQDLSLRVNRFSLADLRTFVKDAPNVTGLLSLTMRAQGTAARPLLQADLTVDQLAIAGVPYAGLTGRGTYTDGRANVDLKLLQDKTHDLTVTGFVPIYIGWGGGRSMGFTGDSNLRIRSDGLSPAFISAFTKDVDNVQGNLTMDILLRGTFAAPSPNGSIQFLNGGARIRSLGLVLTAVDVRANVTPAAVQIVSLSAHSTNGQLTGSGRLGYKGTNITGLGVNLKAQDFTVINTREYKADASGDLLASGTLDAPQLRGNITVKGTFRPNLAALRRKSGVAQDPTIQIVRSANDLATGKSLSPTNAVAPEKTKPSPAAESGIYQRLTMDVNATIARPTWIYVDDGQIDATGRITLRKRAEQELTIAGTIEGAHGFYEFQGRRFQIDTAQLVFTGGSQIDPGLNIIGIYKTGDYEIDLVIGGYMSKPTLTLKSDPVLDQGDILAVLLFGKPASELSQGQKTTLQSQALQATTNFISSDLQRSVASKLGLDTLQFGASEGFTGGQVEAGKYVTSDIFVSTSQQFGTQSSQEYSVEYNVAPNWQIKSSTTPHGNSGIDIFWRKQY
jgi:autotransporter translocation and assembly factor TamB